jgi:hypothetical protein
MKLIIEAEYVLHSGEAEPYRSTIRDQVARAMQKILHEVQGASGARVLLMHIDLRDEK